MSFIWGGGGVCGSSKFCHFLSFSYINLSWKFHVSTCEWLESLDFGRGCEGSFRYPQILFVCIFPLYLPNAENFMCLAWVVKKFKFRKDGLRGNPLFVVSKFQIFIFLCLPILKILCV